MLLDEYDSEDVLVITGAPTSADTFREALGEEIPDAAMPSFIEDVDAVMGTISWQTVIPDDTPELRDITAALGAFHEWLAKHGHMERGQLISEALDVLTGDARDEVIDFDAVLAVECDEMSTQSSATHHTRVAIHSPQHTKTESTHR